MSIKEFNIFKHTRDFIARVEEHQIEVRGDLEPLDDIPPSAFDEDNKVTRIRLGFDWPWTEECSNCGQLVPHDSYHFFNYFWCIKGKENKKL